MNTEVRRNIFCVIMTSEDYLDAFEKLIRFVTKLICTLVEEEATRRVRTAAGPAPNTFRGLSVQDGPEGQAGEGDRSRSDGLLPSGENLQRLLRRAGGEVLLLRPTLPGDEKTSNPSLHLSGLLSWMLNG